MERSEKEGIKILPPAAVLCLVFICLWHAGVQEEEKTVKKENLPIRVCIVCNKPFSWRKKWEKDWDEVKYCSDKCRMNKPKSIN